ncbi:E3 ubiquitin-protein ligase TRIM41-like [Liolophura sinensis]|uniref:E3 ubiquitin-protein ligase TRIM41-like n=1 Tax=Liolophura sinensis TaxID=3198878 RepID=UPI0031591E2F
MAKSMQAVEEELICSICVDIFREPVSLPCHHSFCRECLRLFADKNNPSVIESSGRQINCPVCRSPTVLTDEDVNALPVNTELCGKVEDFGQQDKLTEDTPMCSMCEETSMSPAAMFCSNCDGFFCQQCLTTMHPMKGPFKRHTVKPVNEILAQSSVEESEILDTKSESDYKSECDKHSQFLSIYCVPCKDVICPGCLGDHLEHSCLDLETAVEENKATFEDKAGQLKIVMESVEKGLARCGELCQIIKENQDVHLKSIETSYTTALTTLNNWKANSEAAVRMRHSSWSVECGAWTKALDMQIDGIKMSQGSCKNLISSQDVKFLQGSKQLNERIDAQLTEVRSCLKTYEEIGHKLQNFVRCDPDLYVDLIVKQGPAKERLIFTVTDNKMLKITHNGSIIECAKESRNDWCRALTDGCLQKGRHYWEVKISELLSYNFGCSCCVGVVMESCGRSKSDPGSGHWCVKIQQINGWLNFFSTAHGQVSSAYEKYKRLTGPQHFGLFLNCDNRSLSVLDRSNNQVMFTVQSLDLSEPLIPFVQFKGVKSTSARLVTVDSVTQPKVLNDMFITI